jgi:hypothetical protein
LNTFIELVWWMYIFRNIAPVMIQMQQG